MYLIYKFDKKIHDFANAMKVDHHQLLFLLKSNEGLVLLVHL